MITLLPNRHVRVEVSEGVWVDLRPPTVGEWRAVLEAYTAADEKLSGEGDRLKANLMAKPSPYAKAFATAINLLSTGGAAKVDADKLPLWVTDGRATFGLLYDHWREIKLEMAPDGPGWAAGATDSGATVDGEPLPTLDLDTLAKLDEGGPDHSLGADRQQALTGGLGNRGTTM